MIALLTSDGHIHTAPSRMPNVVNDIGPGELIVGFFVRGKFRRTRMIADGFPVAVPFSTIREVLSHGDEP